MNHSTSSFTTGSFNKLYQDSINIYTNAVFGLADLLDVGKTHFGRKTLIEMTNLPKTKVDYLCSLSSFDFRIPGCPPENYYEILGLENGKSILKNAVSQSLDATDIRRMIREKASNNYKSPKKISTSKWLNNVLAAEIELKTFNGNKKLAAERLKPLVELYQKFLTS